MSRINVRRPISASHSVLTRSAKSPRGQLDTEYNGEFSITHCITNLTNVANSESFASKLYGYCILAFIAGFQILSANLESVENVVFQYSECVCACIIYMCRLAHYGDVIMSALVSQIAGVSIVWSTVCSCTNQRKRQNPRHWPLRGESTGSHQKGPITRKMFPFDDVIMPNNTDSTVTYSTQLTFMYPGKYCRVADIAGFLFLAATKQLYEWFTPSVRPSVCPSVCLSHLFYYVPIILSSWNFQELLPVTKVTSMQKVKVRGQRSRSQRSQPNLTVSGL